MFIPKHIRIETVNGICTCRCTMCTINDWKRKPRYMSFEEFLIILKKFINYKDNIQYITIHGCGEPLLDKDLVNKISFAKKLGFNGLGFATNCTELTEDMARRLIEAGLDTIICSIDGFKKETHEAIRLGTNFYKIVSQVENFIKLRNEKGKTKVIVRFIRQKKNKHEWESFLSYWTGKINTNFDDQVLKFDVHNWGGELKDYNNKDLNQSINIDNLYCEETFERMVIFSDGNIGLCNADENNSFDLGNALIDDPIEIYNGPIFSKFRKYTAEGRINELDFCKNCTIPRSRSLKEE